MATKKAWAEEVMSAKKSWTQESHGRKKVMGADLRCGWVLARGGAARYRAASPKEKGQIP
jgi:hypothetical protein